MPTTQDFARVVKDLEAAEAKIAGLESEKTKAAHAKGLNKVLVNNAQKSLNHIAELEAALNEQLKIVSLASSELNKKDKRIAELKENLAKGEVVQEFYIEGLEKSADEIVELKAEIEKQIEHTRTYIQRCEERREHIAELETALEKANKACVLAEDMIRWRDNKIKELLEGGE